MYIYIDTHTHMYIYIHIYIHTYIYTCIHIYFLMRIHSMQDQPATTKHGVTRKRNTKRYTKSVQKEPAVKRRLLILDLKAISIIGQRKAFYRQRITRV